MSDITVLVTACPACAVPLTVPFATDPTRKPSSSSHACRCGQQAFHVSGDPPMGVWAPAGWVPVTLVVADA
jgi:hypothetical protein